MWHDLIAEFEAELEELRQLQTEYSDLILKSAASKPDKIEVLALASILHSFYGC